MNWIPSKIGAEPKKLGALAALALIALVAYFLNRNPENSNAPARPAPTRPANAPGPMAPSIARPTKRVAQNGLSGAPKEFKPYIGMPKNMDPSEVDPTLHLAALVRLQDVKVDGTSRSLFEISAAPPVAATEIAKLHEPDKIKLSPFIGPIQPKPPPPTPVPSAPPIPLKFYGFVNPARPDIKRAFFTDQSGEDITIAGEGEMIKKRYKVIRIGVNSAEVEDTQFKGNNTKQTLPLETEAQG